MKPRPRIRKTVKWAGAILTIATMAGWIIHSSSVGGGVSGLWAPSMIIWIATAVAWLLDARASRRASSNG